MFISKQEKEKLINDIELLDKRNARWIREIHDPEVYTLQIKMKEIQRKIAMLEEYLGIKVETVPEVTKYKAKVWPTPDTTK